MRSIKTGGLKPVQRSRLRIMLGNEFVNEIIVKENDIIGTKLDYRNTLHQEYKIKEDFQAYFKETENDTELFSSPIWDENRIISFNRGEKIYLKDFEGQDARYLVELENGKRGIMYFGTGD